MRAALVCSNGGVRVQQLEVARARSSSDVLVQVTHAGVNPLDFALSEGYGKEMLDFVRGKEFVLGQEFSGVCVEAGENVFNLKVGDEVWGAVDPWSKCGTLTSALRVNEVDVARKPKALSFAEASSLPFAVMTVWRAVVLPCMQRNPRTALIVGRGNLGRCLQWLLRHYVPGCDVLMASSRQDSLPKGELFDVVVDCSLSLGRPLEMESLVCSGGLCVSFNSPWLRMAGTEGPLKASWSAAGNLLEKKIQFWINQGSSYDWGFMRAGGGAILKQIADGIDSGKISPFERDLEEVASLDKVALSWSELKESSKKVVVRIQ